MRNIGRSHVKLLPVQLDESMAMIPKLVLISAFLSFVGMGANTGCADELRGPARVIDGDTIEVSNVTVRLHGIDAAEDGQRCAGEGRRMVRPSVMATRRLELLTRDGVSCSGTEHDAYGRLIALCRTAKGEDIQRQMVKDGWAWAFVKYGDDYAAEEAEARARHRGVWTMTCEPPWEFRAHQWDTAIQKAPEGCPIKGNISSKGHIYHTPWSRDYAKTRIDTAKGERWFCSEREALDAGWRPPRR